MPFELPITVEHGDIDELGHASNVVYVRWVQDAAVAHSAAVGLGLAEYLARGAVFVVRRHEIDYLRPAMLGDALTVETRVVSISPATSERRTRIRRARDGLLLARATTVWAYLDVARQRPTRIPDEVKQRFTVEPLPEE